MTLTVLKIKNLNPKIKAYKARDGGGLYLYVLPSGIKSWRYDYKLKNDEGKYKNGTYVYGIYPDISLLEARELHLENKKLVSKGIDPNLVKKASKRKETQLQSNLFEQIALEWLNKKGQEVSNTTLNYIKKRLENDVYPEIGNIPITHLTSTDILSMLKKIEKRGAFDMAKRARQYTSQVFKYAIACNLVQYDLTLNLKDALITKRTKHQPALSSEEIPEFIGALNRNEPRLFNETRYALELLMLVFVRPIELVSMKWQEIDFEKKRWVIPSEKMKMRQDHIVPLSKQSLEIIEKMRLRTSNYEYVFTKHRKPNDHMSRDTLSSAIRELGFQGRHTAHGFRALARTTIREKLGWDSEIIERQLAHAPRSNLGRAYDRTQFLEQREQLMQDWADYLDKKMVQK